MKEGFFHPFPSGVMGTGLCVTLVVTLVKSDLAESVPHLSDGVIAPHREVVEYQEIGNRGRPLALLLMIASFPAVAAFRRRGGGGWPLSRTAPCQPAAVF